MNNASLAPDVVRLVIAARVVAFEDKGDEAIKELDEASEAFADRVPWDGEPFEDTTLSTQREAIAAYRADFMRLLEGQGMKADRAARTVQIAEINGLLDPVKAILAVRLDEAAIRKDGIYLVWSNEHSAWWGPNRAGYNTHISHAGRYTREEAIAICVRARGGREFNSNPSEVPIPLKDAEAFWTEDGLEERYRRESRERKEEYEREEIEAASAIRNGGKQP